MIEVIVGGMPLVSLGWPKFIGLLKMVRYCHPWSRGLSPSPPPKKKNNNAWFLKKGVKNSVQMLCQHLWTIPKSSETLFSSWLYQPHSQLPGKTPPPVFCVISNAKVRQSRNAPSKGKLSGDEVVFKGRNLQVYRTMGPKRSINRVP